LYLACMQIITVDYHQGKVLNNSDRELNSALEEGAKIINSIPIISEINGYAVTTSIQYIIDVELFS